MFTNDKSSERIVVVLTLIGFTLFQMNCQPDLQPEVCQGFFSQNRTDEEFSKLNFEDQFAIHRCELDKSATGAYSIAISKRGKEIIPLLLEKLNDGRGEGDYKKEKTKLAVIMVFEGMAIRGDLDDNRNVIMEIERNISRIESDWIRKDALDILAEIKKRIGN